MRHMLLIALFLVFTSLTAHAQTTIPVVTLDSQPQAAPKTETPQPKPQPKPKPKVVAKPKAPTPPPPPASPTSAVTAPVPAPTPVTPPAVTTATAKTDTKEKAPKEKKKAEKQPKEKKPKEKKVKEKKPKEAKVKPTVKEKDLMTPATSGGWDMRKKFSIGVAGTAFLDFGTYESMYLDNSDRAVIATAGSTTGDVMALGLGAQAFAEYGFSQRISGTLQMGYQRLTYANRYEPLVAKDFFTVDALANYYVLKQPKKIVPYVTAGAGVVVSAEAALPTLDVGGGMHVFVTDDISIRAQALGKFAFVFNRLEPSVGVSYHFK